MAEDHRGELDCRWIQIELGKIVQDPEQEWPYRDGFGRGQLPCPGLGIDVAAHGIGRRNLPKAVEYLGPAHIRGVDNEVGPLQGGNGLKAQQA